MGKKLIYSSILAIAIVAITNQQIRSYSTVPPTGKTGAPGEATCNSTGCHAGSSVATGGTITFGSGDTSYNVGQKYTITITGESGAKNGFELVILDANDSNTGDITITDATNTTTQTASSKTYVSHNNSDTTNSWSFDWTAPSSDIGDITLYLAVNKADNSSTASGDSIFTNTLTVKGQGITSLDEITFNESINLYPNPASSFINLDYYLKNKEFVEIVLYNVHGKKVQTFYSGNLASGQYHETFNIDNKLAKGLYYLSLNQGEKVASRKLLIQ